MLDTCVWSTGWIVNNDESGDETAALTVTLSFRSTVAAAVLTLISAFVYLLFLVSSNRRIALTQMSSDCFIRQTSLF